MRKIIAAALSLLLGVAPALAGGSGAGVPIVGVPVVNGIVGGYLFVDANNKLAVLTTPSAYEEFIHPTGAVNGFGFGPTPQNMNSAYFAITPTELRGISTAKIGFTSGVATAADDTFLTRATGGVMGITALGINLPKVTSLGTAPGAGLMRLEVVTGTTAGTCKLQAFAGTSTTPTIIVDNVGGGC